MAILLATLLTFVGLMLIFQLIYFEISRKRALRVNNLVWFEQFNRPFNYTGTASMVVLCIICYMIGGTDAPFMSAQWFLELIIFVACGVIADAIVQFIIIKYGKFRCRQQIQSATHLMKEIEEYKPYTEQEESDRKCILQYLNDFDNVFLRENNYGHFTSSAWVVNKEKTKVLMIHHNIYNSWAWPGGHADGDTDLMHVAIKEVTEETGVEKIRPVTEEIFAIDIIPVWGHIKKGKYVSSHEHLNVTYLLECDESESLKIKEDENSGVKWIPVEELHKCVEDQQMHSIYSKLVKKLELYKKQ